MNGQHAFPPQLPPRHRRRTRWSFVLASLVLVGLGVLQSGNATAQKAADVKAPPADKAMADYADAANFQTGGALDLAIDAWRRFLADHPDHAMAAQAAHYLGVCFMQKENPVYGAAAEAFQQALKNREYDLREESLANLGWCLYASAGQGENRNETRLKQSIQAFEQLQKENAKGKFLDRAYFYSGEAAYGLGDARRAIDFYDKLLSMADAKSSPLRCDALYARGVAQEELKQFDAALVSYRQLLGSCERAELLSEVRLRVGDLQIMRKEYADAAESFAEAYDSTQSPDDRSYALFRQAFALVQADRPQDAAAKYEQLIGEFPDSPFAGSALLASAQSSYRGGDIDGAAERFRSVLLQKNLEAATEAAHWLARIEITRGQPAEAASIVRQQLDRGVEGNFAMDLRLDLAEALSMDPDQIAESQTLFLDAYRDSPDNPLAPRALYNAAFSSLQLNQPEQAIELAAEFVSKFPEDTLVPDVRFIAAESQLMANRPEDASSTYQQLLSSTSRDNPQRPLWLLRCGATSNAAGRFEATIDQLTAELNLFQQPSQKAEAYMLIGQAQLRGGQPEAAIKSLAACRAADPDWHRRAEALLLEGQAQLTSNKASAAEASWKAVIASNPTTPIANQARYKLAQLASATEQFESAVNYYDEILRSDNGASLIPYAQYGKGWALMQVKQFAPALEALEPVLQDNNHPLRGDALLARGITLRNLNQFDAAKVDLEQYLDLPPSGTNLGHALYELALIDQTAKQPGRAAEKLTRLVREVPDYTSMDKVLYELGWSLQESGNAGEAIKYFTDLITRFPNASLVPDAAYFIGLQHYNNEDWPLAASQFQIAARLAQENGLSEKSLYRLGWSEFKDENFEAAEKAFSDQAARHGDGTLAMDALMMIGQCRFKRADYPPALEAFQAAREQIRSRDETAKTLPDVEERRVRELVFLHGGQCAAQLKSWKPAIGWYDELRERFPSTEYLEQVFYETGFAYQQIEDDANALKFLQEVADNYRNELAARARFMMGEIYFGNREFDLAIPEFQRVMFGFGADKAPDSIKNWQAKSGFEAGRCGELLLEAARTPESRQKAVKIARNFYDYVLQMHPNHELAAKSRDRIEALR